MIDALEQSMQDFRDTTADVANGVELLLALYTEDELNVREDSELAETLGALRQMIVNRKKAQNRMLSLIAKEQQAVQGKVAA